MKMLVIFGILVMFTEAGVGLLSMNPVCRFNQSDPCYGAVGQPLYLQLPSEDQLLLKKNINGAPTERIFKFINHKITLNHSNYPRWQFVTDNRSIIISSAEKRNSGRYTLDTWDSAGRDRGVYHLQLVIEGGSTQPLITSHTVVSSVTVTDSCLSIEKRKVYCSSDGDNVHYNWTLQHTHQLADGNQTLLLDKEAYASVTCYAQNHVSHEKKTIEIQQCPGPTTVTTTTPPNSKVTPRTQSGKGLLSMNPVCRFTQSDPCYGAVGRPLYLQLPSEDQLDLKKNINGATAERIFKFMKHKITLNHPDYPRWQFVADNSTMIISSAEKRNSGRYTLDTFDSAGRDRGVYHLQLVIEDVVSSVTVTDSCLSIEKRNVYCSSDGDNMRYSWTFQQTHPLADGNQTLLLDKEVCGSVTCYAQNHVSHGKKTIEIQQCPGLLSMNPVCRFNQSDPCYGAVGRPLYLQLPSEDQLDLKKNINGATAERIFKFMKHKITLNHPDYPRWQFVADNSTMIISSAEKRISGRYTLDTYDSAGRDRGVYHLQLVIEAVVSSVTVTDSCLSIEKRNVYCSSDGDNMRYSWTFQQTHPLADGNQTLLMDKEAHGSVTCYVQNHVSHEKKTIEIQQCPDPTTMTPISTLKPKVTPRTQSGDIVYVVVQVLEITILLSLFGGFHIYARIQRKQTNRAAESKEEEVEEGPYTNLDQEHKKK
ncbi:uncharacterized protein LOC108416420 isoform X2 [Pygocentrus nattereri]|uniref:uncharacterized protein LOC108416420 isoform X2 n=1 Tax=Pygocentrus nattereri TaxID=42514 RepID=UPI0018913C4E|nr:uncharacterized protein LOC108416420 isoform X2 [Pygocentrus nattereri]